MKKLFLILLILAITQNIFTQNINYSFPSVVPPKVSSLMTYVDYPTELYNGMVNVSIPLFTLTEGDIVMPISIYFHQSDIKIIGRNRGRLGVGWRLHGIPSIGRKINSLRDELPNGYLKTNYFKNFTGKNFDRQLAMSKGMTEIDPDVFYYSLLNKAGKFYFNRDLKAAGIPEVVLNPYEPLKVYYTLGELSHLTFRMVDDKGYKYSFENNLDLTRTEYPANGWVSQWNIDTISSPKGYQISFDYYEHYEKRGYAAPNDFAWVEDLAKWCAYWERNILSPQAFCNIQSGNQTVGYPFLYENINNANNLHHIYNLNSRENLNPRIDLACSQYVSTWPQPPILRIGELKTINTSALSADFIGEETLNRIEIKDKTRNQLIKIIVFEYRGNEDTTQLHSISIYDENNTLIENYKFDYYGALSSHYFYAKTPDKNYDHWGYANHGGNSSYESAVPKMRIVTGEEIADPIFSWIGDANHEATAFITAYGALNSIIYPTGRKTTFYYESNQYLHKRTQDEIQTAIDLNEPFSEIEKRIGGGFRIASIEDYDPISQKTQIRKFKYGRDETGIGYLKHQISSDDYMIKNYYITDRGWANPSGFPLAYVSVSKNYQSFPLKNVNNSTGSPMYYDFITEYRESMKDNNFQQMGKTTYYYPNNALFFDEYFNDEDNREKGTSISFEPDYGWANGNLEEKIDYKYQNNSYIPVQKKSFTYSIKYRTEIAVDRIFNRGIIRSGVRSYESFEFSEMDNRYGFLVSKNYNIKTGNLNLISDTIIDYLDHNEIKKIRWYTYSNGEHLFPIKIRSWEENKEIESLELFYPEDLSYSNTDSENARLELINTNQLSTLLKQKITKGNSTWIDQHDYKIVNGKPLPVSIISGKEGTEKSKIQILKYDDYGNPIHVVKDNLISAVYLWGMNGQFLLAELNNITYDEANAALGNSYTPESLSSLPLSSSYSIINSMKTHTDLQKGHITTYIYEPALGLISSTNPMGVTTYYSYDSLGRVIKIYYIDENGNENILENYEYNYRNMSEEY